MDIITFIFINLVMIGAFVFAKTDKEFPWLMYLISGLFCIVAVGGLIAGVFHCCECSTENCLIPVFPLYIRLMMIAMYSIFTLGLFALSSIEFADKEFKGGFMP